MAYEQSNPIENNRLTPSREFLVEKLQASEARIQELEVQVQSLEAELYTLRSPASPRHPVPRSTSPHEAPTITFHIEKPQDLQTEPNVEGKQSSELRRFLKQLPKTDEEWCDRRREVQLSNPEEVTRTFWGFITRTQSQAKTSEIQADPWSLTGERILRDYRQFVGCLQQESVRTVQVSNFAVLLFVCLCRVARMYGVCLETVDDLMDGILPRTKKPEKKKSNYLRKLRSNVLWPVHQAELLRNKYAHRADELFLLYGPSIRTYGRLSEDKSAKDFEHLAVLPLTPAGETNGDIPFSVPLMVKLISGPWFRALETSLSQEQLDAALSSIWARTQCLTVIQCPPAKRRKFDDEARTEDGHGLIEFKNILYPPMVCVQHGREAFSQRGSSASVADGTGSLPYGPGTCSPENEPAMDSDRCNSELADGVRPGNLTVETHGQELWALRLSTSFCSPERIPGNVPELLGFQSQTEVLTLPWHDSPTDLVNGVLRPTNGPSPFTEVMMLLDEPTGREINRDLQHDGREDEAGEESLFGGCIAGTDQLFEHEPSDFSF
ncbi:unnamed protein product [Fusarium fujikuroi]|nr:uncharacterized protein FFE2_08896 [Fusarium fujikuroi]SCO07010.1 uncharacterized protein FFC1_10285 [Fusarium fujikuroi]SCO44761.1 uncharacterized protein FFNC_10025 [Fusarium fujikuroi]VZI03698.1 unnamed protein product [Fusarium fujikuroi]